MFAKDDYGTWSQAGRDQKPAPLVFQPPKRQKGKRKPKASIGTPLYTEGQSFWLLDSRHLDTKLANYATVIRVWWREPKRDGRLVDWGGWMYVLSYRDGGGWFVEQDALAGAVYAYERALEREVRGVLTVASQGSTPRNDQGGAA